MPVDGPTRCTSNSTAGSSVKYANPKNSVINERPGPLAGLWVLAVALAKTLERIHQRRRRRDGIPRADRGAGVDAAERGGRVAVDHDVPSCLVQRFDAQRQ